MTATTLDGWQPMPGDLVTREDYPRWGDENGIALADWIAAGHQPAGRECPQRVLEVWPDRQRWALRTACAEPAHRHQWEPEYTDATWTVLTPAGVTALQGVLW